MSPLQPKRTPIIPRTHQQQSYLFTRVPPGKNFVDFLAPCCVSRQTLTSFKVSLSFIELPRFVVDPTIKHDEALFRTVHGNHVTTALEGEHGEFVEDLVGTNYLLIVSPERPILFDGSVEAFNPALGGVERDGSIAVSTEDENLPIGCVAEETLVEGHHGGGARRIGQNV